MDQFSQSRFYTNEDLNYMMATQTIRSINHRLNQNSQIVQLLKERKTLLIQKAGQLMREQEKKIKDISLARMDDLKKETKDLKDENMYTLITNADRGNGVRHLLKKISFENISAIESTQFEKGKKAYNRQKQLDSELGGKTKKYGQLESQLEEFNKREREFLGQIEHMLEKMASILKNTRKEPDHIKKAERLNAEIEERKKELRENKLLKDKKKKEIEGITKSITETAQNYRGFTQERFKEIEELYGGTNSLQDFDEFLQSFKVVIQNRIDDKRVDEEAIKQLVQLAKKYEADAEEIVRAQIDEAKICDSIYDGFRKRTKLAILERAYFEDISTDTNKLQQIHKKCKKYRDFLGKIDSERAVIIKEISKSTQVQAFFLPKLKDLSEEDERKGKLRKELEAIVREQAQLEEIEKKQRDYDLNMNSYKRQKDMLEKELDEYADKGKLQEYKHKTQELEKIESLMKGQRELVHGGLYEQKKAKVKIELRNLKAKYSSLISEIVTEDEPDYSKFLNKMTRRLSLL